MTFSDEDLGRFKEFIATTRRKYKAQLDVADYKLYDDIEALLDRLEAAEACARSGMNYRLKREEKSKDWKEHLDYFDHNWAAWRTIAGQDPTVYQRDAWRKAAGK